MPPEVALLDPMPSPLEACPLCGRDFVPFLRGQVQRPRRRWFGLGRLQPHCALICSACKVVVGWESVSGCIEVDVPTRLPRAELRSSSQ